jgi:hypothetical protein
MVTTIWSLIRVGSSYEARLDQVHATGEQGDGAELAVGDVSGAGDYLEGYQADLDRGLDGEGQVGAAAGFYGEGLLGGFLFRQAEFREKTFLGFGIDDIEVYVALELLFGGVVDHYLDGGLVALAQETREVGADHQVFYGLGFLLYRAGFEIPGYGVDVDVPRGDRVGDLELDRG